MKKNKLGIIAGGVVGFFLLTSIIGSTSSQTNKQVKIAPSSAQTSKQAAPQPQVAPAATETPVSAPAPAVEPAAPSPASSSSSLSNTNTYTNSSGNTVHSPASSTEGTIPAGATAKCRDGTFSFSQHRSGTCSHHGGVSSWL
jgi:predicted lipid-binding transport protein (Tim44 family)